PPRSADAKTPENPAPPGEIRAPSFLRAWRPPPRSRHHRPGGREDGRAPRRQPGKPPAHDMAHQAFFLSCSVDINNCTRCAYVFTAGRQIPPPAGRRPCAAQSTLKAPPPAAFSNGDTDH